MTKDAKTLRNDRRKAGLTQGLNSAVVQVPLPSRSNQRFAAAAALEEGSPPEITENRTVTKSIPIPRVPRQTSSESAEDFELDQFISYKQGMPVRPGMRLSVRLNLVDENPLNPRAFIIEDDLRDFAENLRTNGQLLPASAYFNTETGRFLLKEGHRRRRGLQLASRPDILLEVLAPTKNRLQAFKEARISNTQRRSHTAYDDAVRFRELLEQGLVGEQSDLAPTFDVSDSYVSKVLSLGEMPRRLLEKMVAHEGLFGIATGYALCQYYRRKGEGATLRLIERIVAGKLTTRQVEQLVRGGDETALTRVNEPQRRARALSRATITGGASGELKAFENGQLKLDVNGLSDEKRDLLFARVLTAFEEIDVTYRAPSTANAEPRDIRR